MLPEAQDFLAESEALAALIAPLGGPSLDQATAFKGWTITDVIRHLHVWNQAAALALMDEAAFQQWLAGLAPFRAQRNLRGFEAEMTGELSGPALVAVWQAQYRQTAALFMAADPKARLPWSGPTMSARSSITARLMETWAHGQEIYDQLGVVRRNGDHIRGIAVLGINTYGWTFKNRGMEPPAPMPHVRLTAPSGAVWAFGEDSNAERIEGRAEEFCQVVTQTRNVADTGLVVTGSSATAWMAIAQCFAGPPEMPPAPGTRCTRRI